ncbi:hypothetical protein BOTBODRAFT_40864 [Botryobasidium botryosum FD-172 SS1]|uniref:Fungal-type protein kinase domain-containing protein n=1 Tax=Botryobasidium botryosum (strain FD-172 SS1) TaxID=930990 RepID=A0A067N1K5_BOTB1|nr:hypothetical protein BOTBODRAFT_40864 [Botryobasidium botryosum FD-172 SS1]
MASLGPFDIRSLNLPSALRQQPGDFHHSGALASSETSPPPLRLSTPSSSVAAPRLITLVGSSGNSNLRKRQASPTGSAGTLDRDQGTKRARANHRLVCHSADIRSLFAGSISTSRAFNIITLPRCFSTHFLDALHKIHLHDTTFQKEHHGFSSSATKLVLGLPPSDVGRPASPPPSCPGPATSTPCRGPARSKANQASFGMKISMVGKPHRKPRIPSTKDLVTKDSFSEGARANERMAPDLDLGPLVPASLCTGTHTLKPNVEAMAEKGQTIVAQVFKSLGGITGPAYWKAWAETMEVERLHQSSGIPHREAGYANFITHRADDETVRGVLGDFDLASDRCDRSGTVPFLAREFLEGEKVPHLFQHDLEAALYALYWDASPERAEVSRYTLNHQLTDWTHRKRSSPAMRDTLFTRLSYRAQSPPREIHGLIGKLLDGYDAKKSWLLTLKKEPRDFDSDEKAVWEKLCAHFDHKDAMDTIQSLKQDTAQ